MAQKKLTEIMAAKFNMDKAPFIQALKETAVPANISDGQFAAFLIVAKEHNLNPLTREIYAFPSQGGIRPMVSIDGWMKIINNHPQYDGMKSTDNLDKDGNLMSITVQIYRKDRKHSVEVTEYMKECMRNTTPWKQWPARMLRHKAMIQAARIAFSFSGIEDPDEFERGDHTEKVVVVDQEVSGVESMKQKLNIGDKNDTETSDIKEAV
jgi:phage recombination protein Bet